MTTKTTKLDKEINQTQKEFLQDVRNYTRKPADVAELLDFMSKFYKYSLRNTMLIRKQWAGAYAVASYREWLHLGYPVQKGQKSRIHVFAPAKSTFFTDAKGKVKPLRYATKQQKQAIKAGKLKTQTKHYYQKAPVFDISQTSAKPADYPKLFPNGPVNYEAETEALSVLTAGIQAYADKLQVPVKTDVKRELGNARGAYLPDFRVILMNPTDTNSEYANVLIHELAHATMHQHMQHDEKSRELQAELVAYVVSSRFDLNTKDSSANYIAGWTDKLQAFDDQQLSDLLADTQRTAKKMIETIETTQQAEVV